MKKIMLHPSTFHVDARVLARALCVGALAVGAPLLSQSAFAAVGTCDLAFAVEVEATAGPAVGPTGYTTVKGAFDAINAGTHQGVINIEVCGSTNEGTTPATLNSSGAGAALYSAVNLRPLVDGLTVTGNPTSTASTGFGVIQLKGADNVTIDGDNPNSAGTNRNLTINNTNIATQIANAVIRIATAANVTSADNITIRNLVLNGNVTGGNISTITSATGSSNSSFVIYAGGNGGATATDAPTGLTSVTGNTAPIGTTINNLVISNNAMNQAARAVVFAGAAASVSNGVTLTNNTIGGSGMQVGAPPYASPASTVHTRGIYVAGANAVTITGNTIQNMLSYVATTASAIDLPTLIGNGGVTISGNTINNVVNNNTGGGAVNGIIISASNSNPVISGNTVNSVQTLAGATVQGIAATQTGTGGLIEMNRVSTIYSRGTGGFAANGINLVNGSAWTVQNNFVWDVNSFFNNGSFTLFGPFGIRITAGTNDKIYNNTVNLSGPAVGGTAIAPSAAFVIAATTSTGADVRNNIFINNLTGAPAGSAVSAIMLPAGGTSAMNLTLNNNDYVAPATIIGQVGTTGAVVSTYTASAFDAGSVAGSDNLRNYTSTLLAANTDNDNASIIADPVIVSSTDLHIIAGSPAQNTGATIAAVSNDIDAQLRPGGSSYDIGADEVDGITPPANDMRATTFVDPANGGIKLVNAAFTPQSSFTNLGTNTQTMVTVRYRIVNAGSFEVYNQTATIPSLAFNASTTVVFPAATLAAVGTYTIFASSELVGDTVPANDQISGTLVIVPPLAGSYNVGTGGDFASLTNAGGAFQVLNSLGASANITLNITSDLTVETGANALNTLPVGVAVGIQPTGAARAITGSFSGGALIRLNGASRVTIDGSIGGAGTDRSLTIQNTSATSPSVILIGSLGATPITDAALKNSIIINGANTSSAVVISDATASGTPGLFSNITIQNNDIRKAFIGVYANGGTAPQGGSNLVYTQNALDNAGANAIRLVGLYMQGVNGATVTQNTVGNFSPVEGESDKGIWLATGTGNATISDNTVSNLGMAATGAFAPIGIHESAGLTSSGTIVSSNTITGLSTTGSTGIRGIAVGSGGVTVQGNKIQDIKNNSALTYGAFGIDVTAGNDDVIQNNFVSDVNHNMTGGGAFDTTFSVIGIRLGAGTGHKVYFNSVNLYGVKPGTPADTLLSTAFAIVSTAQTGIDVRNNIFANSVTGGTTNLARVSVFLPSGGTSAMNLTWNNNAYYFGADATTQGIAQIGLTPGTGFLTTLPTLLAYTSTLSASGTNDNASIAVSTGVPFLSNSDLHIASGSAVENAGTPIAGVTVDIDGDPRTAPAPEIGADELAEPNTAPSITPAVGIIRQAGSAGSNSTIATVSDVEQAAGSLVVTAPTVPVGLTVSSIVNSAGSVSADLVAACTATLGDNTVGLSVSDGFLSTAGSLTVNVTANSAPVLGTYGATSVTTGGTNTAVPSASPTDNGSVVSLTATAPGFAGALSGDPTTGVITIASAGPAGSYVVTVTATDNCGDTNTTTFTLTVSNANSAPTISPVAGVTRQQGSAASSSNLAIVSDAESSPGSLTVTATTVPAGLTVTGIVNTTGTVTGSIAAACSANLGANTVVLNVSDGTLNTDGNLSVNVTANSAPALGTYSATDVANGGSGTVTPSAAPSDNGSVTTLTASAPGFTGTLTGNPSTGVISISGAAPTSPTAYVVTVTATDNCELTSTTTFNLTVSKSANLDVSKDNGVSSYRAGDLLVYTLVLRNLGPDSADGVVFSDIVPAALINASWVCVAANGAVCPQIVGTGSINATIAILPATGRLTYILQANVATPAPALISNTAQVSIAGLPITDPQLQNNSATDTDVSDTIFSNGFEDPIVLPIDKANGQQSISLSNLSQLLDETARIVFSADDANGEAIRVYGRRNDAGVVELALAVRNADGMLRLGAWQNFTGNAATVSYRALSGANGFVLQSARFE